MRRAQRFVFLAVPFACAAFAASHATVHSGASIGALFEGSAVAGEPTKPKPKEKVKFVWATPTANSVDMLVGSEARLMTILTATDNWGIKGKEIDFFAHSDGGDVNLGSATTTQDGGGALLFRGPPVPPGTYNVFAKFAGDSEYEAASLKGTMHIKKSPTEVVMEAASGSNPSFRWVTPAVKRTTSGEHLNRYIEFWTWDNDYTPPQKQKWLTGVPMPWGKKSAPPTSTKIRIDYAGDDTSDPATRTWVYKP